MLERELLTLILLSLISPKSCTAREWKFAPFGNRAIVNIEVGQPVLECRVHHVADHAFVDPSCKLIMAHAPHLVECAMGTSMMAGGLSRVASQSPLTYGA